MPTARFCRLFGIPDRTWRRWRARQRAASPRPFADPVDGATDSRRRRPCCSRPTTSGKRRQLAQQRNAAFCDPPTGPNHVWQLDFSEFETTAGGTWRAHGIADYWSKYEFGWHRSPTGNQFDAIDTFEFAITEAESLLGHPLIDLCEIDPETGAILPPSTLVTDNAGPFRSIRFEAFITKRPELRHVRTRVKSPGHNGVRERAFGSLKHEQLYLDEINDHLDRLYGHRPGLGGERLPAYLRRLHAAGWPRR